MRLYFENLYISLSYINNNILLCVLKIEYINIKRVNNKHRVVITTLYNRITIEFSGKQLIACWQFATLFWKLLHQFILHKQLLYPLKIEYINNKRVNNKNRAVITELLTLLRSFSKELSDYSRRSSLTHEAKSLFCNDRYLDKVVI